MPLKRSMMQQCALLSPAAACIGCVNTLSLQTASDGTRHIAGDNTDWAGMLACLTRMIKTCSNSNGSPITCAVIIGSGATARSAAFALARLPQITSTWICNRTRARAAALAAEFDVESFGLDAQEAPQGMLGRGVIVMSTVSCPWSDIDTNDNQYRSAHHQHQPHNHNKNITISSSIIMQVIPFTHNPLPPLSPSPSPSPISRSPPPPSSPCPLGSSPLLLLSSTALMQKHGAQYTLNLQLQPCPSGHGTCIRTPTTARRCTHPLPLPTSSTVSCSFLSKRYCRCLEPQPSNPKPKLQTQPLALKSSISAKYGRLARAPLALPCLRPCSGAQTPLLLSCHKPQSRTLNPTPKTRTPTPTRN